MLNDLLARIGELKHQVGSMKPTETNIVEAIYALADVVEDALLVLKTTSATATAAEESTGRLAKAIQAVTS